STLAADLNPYARLEVVGHDEVAVTTRTEVRQPIAEPPPEPAAGDAEPGPPDSPAPEEPIQ
ncbi:MAG TPA: DNA-binding response regulator, partial [Actinomycetes bacterium]|nr:DNA-binding response regulator [Actinomycetes bacterium]